MIGLEFPDEAAVRAALPLLPPGGGRVARGEGGSLLVTADVAEDVVARLVEAGVRRVAPAGGRPFVAWAELVAPVPDPDPDLREVLFVVDGGWLELAAELVRLGCDDVDVGRLGGGGFALRARHPPFYTVAKAADGAWRAFVRQASGVWVELGFRHPLGDEVTVPDGAALWIGRDGGWRVVAEPRWTELGQRLQIALPDPEPAPGDPIDEVLRVRLRLVSAGERAAPSLWRVPERVGEVLAALVDTLPDAVVQRLELARFAGGAVLRARPGAAPPVLEGLEAYAAHPHLPSLYVPAGRSIDPPLRASTVRRLLDPGPDRVGWLEPREAGGFAPRSLDLAAFRLLSERVLYEADADAEAVDAWIAASRFDWEPLDLPIAAGGGEVARRSSRRSRSRDVPPPPAVEVAPASSPATPRATAPRVSAVAIPIPDVPLPAPAEAQLELEALQRAFRADPRRDDLWAPMAEMHHALGQPLQAALCWSRAVWEADEAGRAGLAEAWVARVGAPDLVDEPSAEGLAAVAAHVLAGRPPGEVSEVQVWLAEHDALLDVRTRWLVRRRLARLAGDDQLALARARDAVLASMRTGLVPARDVPAFLRTSTTPEEHRILAASLASLVERLPPMAPSHAPVACSGAYARLTLAWAQACLGLAEPVRAALAAAERDLPPGDPVHAVLLGLYRSGVEEALAGLPAETPPPPEVRAALAALDRFSRYKVDRLRDQSVAVLAEPGVSDAFTGFLERDDDALVSLPADELLAGLEARLADLDEDEPAPGLQRVLQALVALEEADAARVLDQVLARAVDLSVSDRVPVLVEAVAVAAALRRPDRVEGVLSSLSSGLLGLLAHDPKAALAPARALARSLARCGLTGPGQGLFAALRDASEAWDARLQWTAALAQVGGDVSGEAERGLALLDGDLSLQARLAVVGAVADLAAPLPVSEAVALWGALVPQAGRVPDSFSTSSHFALSYLQVVEVLAAAHVHPDRLLGQEGRALLEVDEQRVRMKIHQEERREL